MEAARKNELENAEDWITVTRAVGLLDVGSTYSVVVLALRGKLRWRYEEIGQRLFISRESIDQYLQEKSIDRNQLSVAL